MPSFDDDPFVDDRDGRKDVAAVLTYTKPLGRDGQRPVQIVPGFRDDPGTTVLLEDGPFEQISDVRGREAKFTLEENGFVFKKHVSKFAEWDSKWKIQDVYCNQEMVQFISDALGGKAGGVDEVLIFQQQRRGSGSQGSEAKDGERTNPFAKQVHLDMPESTIIPKLRSVTDIKFPWALQGRVRQVNVWRPLFHPVYDCGLTIADAKTVTEDDMIEIFRVKPNGEFFDTMGGVHYRPGYKWYYMSQQTPDDVLIFMGYDSACARGQKSGLGYTFHSAFDIANAPPDAPTRQSIEIRAFVLTYPATPLTIQPVPPGRLSASTPRPHQVSTDSYFSHIVDQQKPITFVDLDDLSSQPYPLEAYNDRELYLVRHGGVTQVVDLQSFSPECPRHPLQDSIMCRVLAAEDAPPEPYAVSDQAEYEKLEASGVDVLDVQFGRRMSAGDLENRRLREKVRALEKDLESSRLQVAVLTARLNEPELML